MSENICSQN